MPFTQAKQLSWIYELYHFGQTDAFHLGSNKIYEHILQHVVAGFNAKTGSLALYVGDTSPHLSIVAGIGLPHECIGSPLTEDSSMISRVINK